MHSGAAGSKLPYQNVLKRTILQKIKITSDRFFVITQGYSTHISRIYSKSLEIIHVRRSLLLLLLMLTGVAGAAFGATICPTTSSTNTDCGYIFTIGVGNTISGSAVANANPYDGADDALVGVVNNSGAVFTGSITLTGTGNGGGIFAFDGDGICAYITASYCSTAPTGYEGPLNTFSGINAAGTTGTINITGLGIGATTFFSLEGSPASIVLSPEPATFSSLAGALCIAGYVGRKRRRAIR